MGRSSFNKRSTREARRAHLQKVATADPLILNFDCQWCGQPFRARSQPVIPCPLCKSEHGPESGYISDAWTTDDLLELADEIGGRIAAGRLPPQNEFGQYLI